jgi:1-acyl-sn-glycerol-3-phosphate acyltransferase
LLYKLLKLPATIAVWIYCRKISINNKSILKYKGPLLIACNHPNSFLDAIILSSIFKQPIHSLARGDVFKNNFYNTLLRSLKMLPVYRTSEGVENMEHNYTSFNACKEIFKNNGIVLIFSEGKCINEWHLRPLMKGTARLAISSWKNGIPLKVLPLGINYQSFYSFGKNIHINTAEVIEQKDVDLSNGFGKSLLSFNNILQKKLQPLVYEIDKNDTATLKEKFGVSFSIIKKIALIIPAILGYTFHIPLFAILKKVTWKRASHNDHYDSILVGLLFVLYPIFLIAIVALLFGFTKSYWCFSLLLIAPFCAWSYVQLKKQF